MQMRRHSADNTSNTINNDSDNRNRSDNGSRDHCASGAARGALRKQLKPIFLRGISGQCAARS